MSERTCYYYDAERNRCNCYNADLALLAKAYVMQAENAKLRDSLKALMMGTNMELCADRDASQCQECSMALDENRCAMSDAMLLLGIDMYGEPLGGD